MVDELHCACIELHCDLNLLLILKGKGYVKNMVGHELSENLICEMKISYNKMFFFFRNHHEIPL